MYTYEPMKSNVLCIKNIIIINTYIRTKIKVFKIVSIILPSKVNITLRGTPSKVKKKNF